MPTAIGTRAQNNNVDGTPEHLQGRGKLEQNIKNKGEKTEKRRWTGRWRAGLHGTKNDVIQPTSWTATTNDLL